MRNLLEYPLNETDVKDVINRLIDDFSKKRMVGGMDGVVLHQLNYFLEKPENMQALLSTPWKTVDARAAS